MFSISTLKVLARKQLFTSLSSIGGMTIHLRCVRLHLTAFWLFVLDLFRFEFSLLTFANFKM